MSLLCFGLLGRLPTAPPANCVGQAAPVRQWSSAVAYASGPLTKLLEVRYG